MFDRFMDRTQLSKGIVSVVRGGTTWYQQAYLKANNADSLDLFGSSVSISGDTIVVGAYLEAYWSEWRSKQ
jgi:hypothetical protein